MRIDDDPGTVRRDPHGALDSRVQTCGGGRGIVRAGFQEWREEKGAIDGDPSEPERRVPVYTLRGVAWLLGRLSLFVATERLAAVQILHLVHRSLANRGRD